VITSAANRAFVTSLGRDFRAAYGEVIASALAQIVITIAYLVYQF
jgi:hypothetical protein